MADHTPKSKLKANGWLAPTDAAKHAATSESTVYRLIREGAVEWVRVGGRLYVAKASLDDWVGECALAVLAELEEAPCD
jgi:excisionase family DNA binding protein